MSHHGLKILFILKRRISYGKSYGLFNSCHFICQELHRLGIECKLVEVLDGNIVDKEVHHYRPTHVIIEALWVVPEKFKILIKKYSKIKWYVRLHSQVPFLAHEGSAIEWIKEYDKINNLKVAANHKRLQHSLKSALGIDCEYLPNIYPFKPKARENEHCINGEVNLACYGAVRPFKNHLQQALAAIIFADQNNLILNFHINHSRYDQTTGEGVLKNLKSTFKGSKHRLIGHEWSNHHDFIEIVKKMDIGMQVSFTETFNIVAADFVSHNISFVGSKEIDWLSEYSQADPNDIDDIVKKLNGVYNHKLIRVLNENGLKSHNSHALRDWKRFLEIGRYCT